MNPLRSATDRGDTTMLTPPDEGGGRLDLSVADAADGDAGAHDPMAIGDEDDGETPPGLPPPESGLPDDGGGGGENDIPYNPHVRSPHTPSLPRAQIPIP